MHKIIVLLSLVIVLVLSGCTKANPVAPVAITQPSPVALTEGSPQQGSSPKVTPSFHLNSDT
jgi:hypothetical protein